MRPLTLRDWTILRDAKSPLVCGGEINAAHVARLAWLLRTGWRSRLGECGWVAEFLRGWSVRSVLKYKGEPITEALNLIDDAFMDAPGADGPPAPMDAANLPHVATEVAIASELMRAFPSLTHAQIIAMPLAQVWQWQYQARVYRDPEYRTTQPTDEVNRAAVRELMRLRADAKNKP